MATRHVKDQLVIKMLRTTDKTANMALLIAVGAMAHEAKKQCEIVISATDHSLKDLAAMGHPYAARDTHNPHDPPEIVHAQSGALRAGLTASRPVAGHGIVRATVSNNESELDAWIQLGTRTMIARPYMSLVRRKFGKIITGVGLAILARWSRGKEKGVA